MIGELRKKFLGDGFGATMLKAVVGSAGIRILGLACSFAIGVLLARGMGAEGYGIYGVAMSIIALLTVPTEFGLSQLLTREVATAHAQRRWGVLRGVIQWAGKTSLLISLIVLVCFVVWLLWSGQGIASPLGKTMCLGIALVPLVAFVSQRSAALRGMQHIVSGQLPDVLLRPATHAALLTVMFFAAVPLTPDLAMGLGVIAASAALIVATTMLRRALPFEARLAPPEKHVRAWLCSAIPMAMTDGMRVLQAHMLLLILGWLVPMAEVGVFRMASSVSLLVSMPISLLNIVCMPVVARLHANGDHIRLERMLPLVALGMTLGVSVLTLPFIWGGETLLKAVFGSEFSAGNPVLLVLCLGVLSSAMFGAVAILLTMTGHQALVTKASLLSVCVLFITAWPLIASFGVMGAAWANFIATIPWNILMWRYAKNELKLDASVLPLLQKLRLIERSV